MPLITFCQGKPSDSKFIIAPNESRIVWKGTQALGGGHEGTIQLSSGSLDFSPDGKLKGGSFIVNMKSIVNTDIRPERSGKELVEHLNSEDFFSVYRYPTAAFVITRIMPANKPNVYTITGNFTLKGFTNTIMFPATVVINQNQAKAQAEISIDRTRWGITYKAYNFLAQVKDEMISNDIRLSLNLVFNIIK